MLRARSFVAAGGAADSMVAGSKAATGTTRRGIPAVTCVT
jgi:hypothetical protein